MNQITRLLFIITAFLGNLISRSLHCQVGRPNRWFFPPNWS
jgi:hypothetical protein